MSGHDDASAFVPPALATRVEAALASGTTDLSKPRQSVSPEPVDYLAAGERLLDDVLRGAGRDRGTALDLLAADALVTRAFELVASEPASLERLARESMRRIAAHVDEAHVDEAHVDEATVDDR